MKTRNVFILILLFACHVDAGSIDGMLFKFQSDNLCFENIYVNRADMGLNYTYPIMMSAITYVGHWQTSEIIICEGAAIAPTPETKIIKAIYKKSDKYHLYYFAMAGKGRYGCEISLAANTNKYIGTDDDELGPGSYGFILSVRGSDLDQVITAVNAFMHEAEFRIDTARFEKMKDPIVLEGTKEILEILKAERGKPVVNP
jgi:hypothetical protein